MMQIDSMEIEVGFHINSLIRIIVYPHHFETGKWSQVEPAR